jgi:hypothetical protein
MSDSLIGLTHVTFPGLAHLRAAPGATLINLVVLYPFIEGAVPLETQLLNTALLRRAASREPFEYF